MIWRKTVIAHPTKDDRPLHPAAISTTARTGLPTFTKNTDEAQKRALIFPRVSTKHGDEVARAISYPTLMASASQQDSRPHYENRNGFPTPTIIPPRHTHTHSIILLHGRNGDGRSFGIELITTQLLDANPQTNTLSKCFPSLKFIFPSAKYLRALVCQGRHIQQWFDVAALGTQHERTDLQRPGLQEATRYIHKLIDAEAENVGLENVIIGGYSQGAAATLCALLGYDNSGKGQLGGYVGMSGWLPFGKELRELVGEDKHNKYVSDGQNGEGNNPGDSPELKRAAACRATNYMRENVLNLPPLKLPLPAGTAPRLSTPIWLAHGAIDEKVSVKLGESAALTAQSLGCDVTWMEYEDLGHHSSPAELADLAIFLSARVGVPEQPRV